jgi:hypothetical protein
LCAFSGVSRTQFCYYPVRIVFGSRRSGGFEGEPEVAEAMYEASAKCVPWGNGAEGVAEWTGKEAIM